MRWVPERGVRERKRVSKRCKNIAPTRLIDSQSAIIYTMIENDACAVFSHNRSAEVTFIVFETEKRRPLLLFVPVRPDSIPLPFV